MTIRTKLNYSTAEKDFSYASDYENVQKSLESSKNSYLDQVAKNEANIKAMYDKVDTEVGQYTSGQEGVAIDNPGIDFQETWGDSKQEYAALNRKIVAGVGTVEDRARLSKLDATVNGAKNFAANLLVQTQNYDIARENPGGEGGVDLTSLTNTPEKLLSMEILSGRASGSQKMIIDPNTLEQRLEVSDSKGKLLNTVYAKQLSTSLDAGGAGNIDLLKDARPQQTAVVKNLINKETDKIANSFYIGSGDTPETFSKEITLEDGTKKIQYYNKLNVEAVKDRLFIPATAAADGFISENQNNPQAISSYYNSILGPSQIDFITGKPVPYEPFESGEYTGTDEQKEKFKKAFLNNTFNNNIVKTRNVKMEEGMVATPKPLETLSPGERKKEIELKNRKNSWETRLEERIKTLGLGINKEGEVFTGKVKPFDDNGKLRPEFEKALSGLGYTVEEKIEADDGSKNPKHIGIKLSMPGVGGNKISVFQDQVAQDFIYNLGIYTFGVKENDWAGKYAGKFKPPLPTESN